MDTNAIKFNVIEETGVFAVAKATINFAGTEFVIGFAVGIIEPAYIDAGNVSVPPLYNVVERFSTEQEARRYLAA